MSKNDLPPEAPHLVPNANVKFKTKISYFPMLPFSKLFEFETGWIPSIFRNNMFAMSPAFQAESVQTRFMRNDNVLGLSETTSLTEDYCDVSSIEYYGIRAWVLHADTSRTEVLGLAGIASAVITFLAGSALTTTMYAGFGLSSDMDILTSDKLQIEVYADISNPPTALLETFTSEALNATKLKASNWVVYYRVRRTRKIGSNSFFYFRFGATSDSSYITGIKVSS